MIYIALEIYGTPEKIFIYSTSCIIIPFIHITQQMHWLSQFHINTF